MRIAVCALVSVVALAPTVLAGVTTTIKDIGKLLYIQDRVYHILESESWKAPDGTLDQDALRQCLKSYRNNNWDGMECGVSASHLDLVVNVDTPYTTEPRMVQ